MSLHASIPAPLARARDRLRALPADNPRFAVDALLIMAGAATEAAIYCEAAEHQPAADGFSAIAAECRALAGRAQSLAAIFAPVGGPPA